MLSERFKELAEGATPGPWSLHPAEVIRPGEAGNANAIPLTAMLLDSALAPLCDMECGDFPVADARFIAFCGTHRAALLAAVELAEAVDLFCGVEERNPGPEGTVIPRGAQIALWMHSANADKALSAFRSATAGRGEGE